MPVVGNVNQSLAEYYAERVATTASQAEVKERQIRDWVEHHLITESGLRGQVLMGPGESDGLSNRAIFLLEDAHLVRAEKRLGATWFELAHDRLIQPVRSNNAGLVSRAPQPASTPGIPMGNRESLRYIVSARACPD